MNCEEFRPVAQAMARDEELDLATLEAALSHADSCELCDALLNECETLTSELRALAAHYAEGAPARVESRLLAAVRQRGEPEFRSWGPWPGAVNGVVAGAARRRAAAFIGVAAAVVLVFALSGRPKALWHSAVVAFGPAGQRQSEPGTSLEPALSSPETTSNTEESADSFVPLSGAYDLASLNDDPIVRVVLSDDDLESLGLPVGAGGDEQVLADLIVANDGTPQAIRVVSW
jgi:hypothetical protein